MEAKRQVEEDALRVSKLLDYLLSPSIKDELQAQSQKIKNGKDAYKREEYIE